MIRWIANVLFITAFIVMTAMTIYQQRVIGSQDSAIRTCVALLVINGIIDEEMDSESEPQEVLPEDKGFRL